MATYAGQYGPEAIEYPDSGHAILSWVQVLNLDGTDAVLYADRIRSTVVDNPVQTDALGNLVFFAEPGFYKITTFDESTAVIVSVPTDPVEPDAGGITGFTFVQNTPAATWTVPNTLGRNPRSITMIVGGQVVDSDFDVSDINQIVVTNSSPVAGRLEVA